tara:strand:- start:1327 stop:1767 length:441 start_codon:yes stop_codon:yes gene_type:complete
MVIRVLKAKRKRRSVRVSRYGPTDNILSSAQKHNLKQRREREEAARKFWGVAQRQPNPPPSKEVDAAWEERQRALNLARRNMPTPTKRTLNIRGTPPAEQMYQALLSQIYPCSCNNPDSEGPCVVHPKSPLNALREVVNEEDARFG